MPPRSSQSRSSLFPPRPRSTPVGLLLLHDPDPVPPIIRRAGLVVAAAVPKNSRGPVLGSQLECFGKVSDTAPPVASLIAIETRLVSGDHRSNLGESQGRVMAERFIDPGRLRNALGLDQVEAAQDRRRSELVDRGRR